MSTDTTEGDELPLEVVMRASPDGRHTVVVCPHCAERVQRPTVPWVVWASTSGPGRWAGSGDLIVVPFRGACGHTWEICFGPAPGYTAGFVRTHRPAGGP